MASTARYAGTCTCGAAVAAGAPITSSRDSGRWRIVACTDCDPERHPPASPPIRAKVRVLGIPFSRPDGTFTIAKTEVLEIVVVEDAPSDVRPKDLLGVKGRLPHPLRVGDILEVRGSIARGQYGLELSATLVVPVVAATDQALRAFLAHLPQVGPRRAEQLLQVLGGRQGVLEAIEHEPSRLCAVPGITEERAAAIAEAYRASSEIRDSAMFLAELDLGEALTANILDEWGPDARAVLTEDPYQLMQLRGVGFRRADEIAVRKLHVAEDDPRRLAAAVLDLLEAAERQGHTYATLDDLVQVARDARE